MHLTAQAVQKPLDRRTTGMQLNYIAGEPDRRQLVSRESNGRLSLVSAPNRPRRSSIDSTGSHASMNSRYHRQQLVRRTAQDSTFCLQRISNV